jgi:hypothetical protein
MKRIILSIILTISTILAFGQSKAKTKDTAANIPTITNTAFKVRYDYVFKRNSDGTYSALYPVQVNGDIIGSGIPFAQGTPFGGVDVAAHAGHDLLIDTVKGVIIIRKFLK